MSFDKSKPEKTEIISARCDAQVKGILDLLSQTENLSMSEIISKSLIEYYQNHFPNQSFLEMEKELFGRYSSGKKDLAVSRRKYLRKTLHEKHGHH